MNLVHGLAHHEFLVTQWLEHLISVRKVPFLSGTRIFSLSHAGEMMITSFLISLPSLAFTIILY